MSHNNPMTNAKDTNLKANHNSAPQIASHSIVDKDIKLKINNNCPHSSFNTINYKLTLQNINALHYPSLHPLVKTVITQSQNKKAIGTFQFKLVDRITILNYIKS